MASVRSIQPASAGTYSRLPLEASAVARLLPEQENAIRPPGRVSHRWLGAGCVICGICPTHNRQALSAARDAEASGKAMLIPRRRGRRCTQSPQTVARGLGAGWQWSLPGFPTVQAGPADHSFRTPRRAVSSLQPAFTRRRLGGGLEEPTCAPDVDSDVTPVIQPGSAPSVLTGKGGKDVCDQHAGVCPAHWGLRR